MAISGWGLGTLRRARDAGKLIAYRMNPGEEFIYSRIGQLVLRRNRMTKP
jgi:hypothetical protein